jgi:hypothetical protein
LSDNHTALSFSSGENKSIIRVEIVLCRAAKLNFLMGTQVLNARMKLYHEQLWVMSVYFKTFTNGKNFSPSLGGRTTPFTVSPVLSPNNLIWDVDKYHLVMQDNYNQKAQETIAISHHFQNTFTFYYSIKFKVRSLKLPFLVLKLGF